MEHLVTKGVTRHRIISRIIILVAFLCQPCLSQENGEETTKLPPLITAEVPDEVWYQADNEFFEFTLDCKAEGTEPLEYKWEKVTFDDAGVRSVVKDYSQDADDVTISESTLSVELPQATHEGFYQCTVTNGHGVALSPVVDVKMFTWQRPKKGDDVIENNATEGESYRMACDVMRSSPPALFMWELKSLDEKTNTPVETSDRVVVAGDGALIFANVLPEDEELENRYQCEQSNPKYDVKAGGKLNTLGVARGPARKHAPELQYFTELEDDTVVLGGHVRVQCVFSGNPTPAVSWTYDDESVPEVLEHPGRTENKDKTTLFRAMGKRLGADEPAPPPEGTLTCKGSSSQGDAEKQIPIKIQYPPRLAASPSVRRVASGEEVIFSCGADGNPKPNVMFMINGEKVEGTDRRVLEEMSMDWKPYRKENSVLLVLRIPETCLNTDEKQCEEGEDVFSIQCFASNKHGSAIGSGYLSVYESVNGTDDGGNGTAGLAGENECTDPEVLASIDSCKETYQADVDSKGLCLAYCHYHVCIKDLDLDCEAPSIGDREFCNGLCIKEGLMVDPNAKDDEEEHKGWSKKTKTILMILLLLLILLLILILLCIICKKRRKHKPHVWKKGGFTEPPRRVGLVVPQHDKKGKFQPLCHA